MTDYLAIGHRNGLKRTASGKTIQEAQFKYVEANNSDPWYILTKSESNMAQDRIDRAVRILKRQGRI